MLTVKCCSSGSTVASSTDSKAVVNFFLFVVSEVSSVEILMLQAALLFICRNRRTLTCSKQFSNARAALTNERRETQTVPPIVFYGSL